MIITIASLKGSIEKSTSLVSLSKIIKIIAIGAKAAAAFPPSE